MVKTQPSNAGSVGSTPGQEAKIPHATGCRGKNKIKFYYSYTENHVSQEDVVYFLLYPCDLRVMVHWMI